MRSSLLILPLAFLAAPALAAPSQPPLQPPLQPPPQLSDPRLADHLTGVMKAMSTALLNLPVGEIEAAAQGRAPTPVDRARTVRSETGMDERDLDRTIDQSRVAVQQGFRAVAEALPKIAGALDDVKRQMKTATANMPRPDYPKR
jgi:hypothetical protein